MFRIPSAHLMTPEEVLAGLEVSIEQGLSDEQIRQRQAEFGPNQLAQTKPRGLLNILLQQFRSSIVVLLVVAAALSFLFREWLEGVAIIAVIFINAAIGFFTEVSAVRSMEALYRMGSVSTRVRRSGITRLVPAVELVPGDIVVLEAGDIITADLRIVEAAQLQCDESALTGESVPVSKQLQPLTGEPPVAGRTNMLYKGTALTRGAGEGVVVASGMDTELGKITELVEEAEDEITPLEKRLGALARTLVWVVVLVAGAVTLLGVSQGRDLYVMVETGIALAVASIPEGLPIVATIALSRGLLRMARRQALVRQLSSVETLGSANIICVDKTGTMTENRMTVTRVDLIESVAERTETGEWILDEAPADLQEGDAFFEALKISILCNNATLHGGEDRALHSTGDPLEVALLAAALEAGLDLDEITKKWPRLREEPFDSESKMMATYHKCADNEIYVAVKGAPETILDVCTSIAQAPASSPMTKEEKERWLQRNAETAAEGHRMLALGYKRVGDIDAAPYEGLTLAGLVGLLDPPRLDVRESLERCQSAGIRVIMVTGDQAPTALYVAKAVGIAGPDETTALSSADLKPVAKLSESEKQSILDANVLARVNPEQKLDLIALHQKEGAIVAMTGDGVNDAPALKKADIGVAMGLRGTQVAQEVADVVLKDDSFRTIVYAVQEGRVIFGNIRKFVFYLLSCNIAEILVILLASFVNTPLPILPLQILFLNFVTDVFPALALGVGEGDESVMNSPPRSPKEPILTRGMWGMIVWHGVVIATATLSAFFVALFYFEADERTAVTVAFLTLAGAQLVHVFDMRDRGSGLVRNDVSRNPYVWGALALCITFMAAAVFVPVVSDALKTTPLHGLEWLLVAVMSVVPVAADTVVRWVKERRLGRLSRPRDISQHGG